MKSGIVVTMFVSLLFIACFYSYLSDGDYILAGIHLILYALIVISLRFK